MSADFWAGYISGAVGILIGNPLDLIKVRLQADRPSLQPTRQPATIPVSNQAASPLRRYFPTLRSLITGTAAPILGYGALNALLFVSYNRSEALLNTYFPSSSPAAPGSSTTGSNLYTTFLAGAIGGLATWAVSTPTELIKCRAQVQTCIPPMSSMAIATQVLRTEGVRGLYFGGAVTAIRDSVGYGFYFWSYELSRRWMEGGGKDEGNGAASVLLCGGLAGIITWASIFPLDVIKTRVQTQVLRHGSGLENAPLLGVGALQGKMQRLGAWAVAKEAYREGGMTVFFRGLTVCSVRAFIVNAVQWAVYEWIMLELGQGRNKRKSEARPAMEID